MRPYDDVPKMCFTFVTWLPPTGKYAGAGDWGNPPYKVISFDYRELSGMLKDPFISLKFGEARRLQSQLTKILTQVLISMSTREATKSQAQEEKI